MSDSKELLQKVSDISTESEYFSPVPKGYKKGKCRYSILVGKVKHTCDGIDTPEQYAEFVNRYKEGAKR